MNGMTRAGATLLGAAGAGVLLWLAAQLGRQTNGSYWAAYALVAAAGLVFAVSQWRGRTGFPPGMLALGFLPVLVVAGWVLLAMQPDGNWFRAHVLELVERRAHRHRRARRRHLDRRARVRHRLHARRCARACPARRRRRGRRASRLRRRRGRRARRGGAARGRDRYSGTRRPRRRRTTD